MQLPKNEVKFDYKKVQQILKDENKFITDLLSIVALPDRNLQADPDEQDESEKPQLFNNLNKKSRAKSLQELEERLKAITSKKKLTYKEKLAKKGLKSRMKKKNKQDERNARSKIERATKLTLKTEDIEIKNENIEETTDNKKPVFNSENKLVFSKIDFANLGKKKHKKQEKDPKKILQKLNEEKNRIGELKESGEIHKAVEIKEKTAWKNALAKAEGQKVKDDPILLKKSVKKKEQKVRSSKKKWEARISGVQKAKDEKQKKRTENLAKRKKEKKVKKLKSASKRGKIIPGF